MVEKKNKKITTLMGLIIILLISHSVSSYKIADGTEVHQQITNEAKYVWELMPYELYDAIGNNIETDHSDTDLFYNNGENVIDGSDEEDALNLPLGHFWQPDSPENGAYDHGLEFGPCPGNDCDSSWVRARNYWRTKAIPYYIEGNEATAYYWLGRTAHLLEDAAQPSHVHLDAHGSHTTFKSPNTLEFRDDSILEDYTGNEFSSYTAQSLGIAGEQYDYENLIPSWNYNDWKATNYGFSFPTYEKELFQLFWYTAQKTQYFASDDVDGNSNYRKAGSSTLYTLPNLWVGDGVTIVDDTEDFFNGDLDDETNEDFYYSLTNSGDNCEPLAGAICELAVNSFSCWYCDPNEGTNIENEADATLQHAMKAVGGLYRLFWDAVHAPTWETSQHDNQRTGHTILRGDLTSFNHNVRIEHTTTGVTEFWDDIVVTDLDRRYGQGHGLEMVVAATNYDYTQGEVYVLDDDGDETWSFTDSGAITDTRGLTVTNLDSDQDKEIIFTNIEHISGYYWSNESTLYVLDANKNNAVEQCTFKGVSLSAGGHAPLVGIATDDVDQDGEGEIIVTEFSLYSGDYNIYSLDDNCDQEWNQTLGAFGSQELPAMADLDDDGKLEIVVIGVGESPVRIFNAEDGSFYSNTTGNGTEYYIYTDPVIADIDADGDFEIITGLYTIDSTPEAPQLLVFNDQGEIDWQVSLDYTPVASPAVANIDGDDALEIIIATAQTPDWDNAPNKSINDGSVYAFDGNTHAQQWRYDTNAKVQSNPAIADIDNDGSLEVIVTDYSGSLKVISSSGSLEWSKDLGSFPIGSPIIGDVDGDGVAEIVLKHAHGVGEEANNAFGPPGMIHISQGKTEKERKEKWENKQKKITTTTQFSLLSSGEESTLEVLGGSNDQPLLGNISNISISEGDLLNINASGEITATDADNDTLTFYYNSPLNDSGYWQTDCTSAGNYSVLVEVSDGNLSDWRYVNVQVNESCDPSLQVSLLEPTSSTQKEQNEFFEISAQVCCEGITCGEINVSLDPIPEDEILSPYEKKSCRGKSCTTSMFSFPRYGYEHNEWKPIESLMSFKGTIPLSCHVESDGVHHVECVDFNSTHRLLRINVDTEKKNIRTPIRILTPALENDQLVMHEERGERITINFAQGESIEQWFRADLNDEMHVGAESTIITIIPNESISFSGWWESTGGTQALYGWSDCDANTYSSSDKASISVNSTANSIYGSGGGTNTTFSYCHRMRWEINSSLQNITKINAYAWWTGSPHAGSDSITKALYIGDASGSAWTPLHVQENAWAGVEHTGSVTSNINNYIESSGGSDYVYTLLHYNATKSSGSSGAYSNFYYAQLEITTENNTGNTTNATTKDGLVSTQTGATPFYTNSSNPITIELNNSMCQNITWYVNSTGELNSTHDFFIYANQTLNQSFNNESTRINITIVETAGNGSTGGWSVVDTDTFASSAESWTGGTRDATTQTYNSSSDWSTIRKNYTLSQQNGVINITINGFTYNDDTSDPKIYVPGNTASDNDYLLFDGTKPNINWKHIDDNSGYGECNEDISGTISWSDGDNITISTNYTSGEWCTYHNNQKCRCETSTLAHGDNFEINPGNAHTISQEEVIYSTYNG